MAETKKFMGVWKNMQSRDAVNQHCFHQEFLIPSARLLLNIAFECYWVYCVVSFVSLFLGGDLVI